jgi:hypothetical protein
MSATDYLSSELKPAHSDSCMAKSSSYDTDQVLVGAPGMNFAGSDGGLSRSVVSHRTSTKPAMGAPDLKKSFNQMFGKISDRMKVRRQDTGRFLGDADLDSWDSQSQRSDALSDDDDDASSFIYQLDSQQELPAFDHPDAPPGDEDASVDAVDVREDESDICSEIKDPGSKMVRRTRGPSVQLCSEYIQKDVNFEVASFFYVEIMIYHAFLPGRVHAPCGALVDLARKMLDYAN